MQNIFVYEFKHFSPGNVAGQLTTPPLTCPGNTFTLRCTVTGNVNGFTIWRVGASSNLCPLLHMSTSTIICMPIGTSNAFAAEPGSNFGTTATSYSSTLSGTATPDLDGTLVECFGPTYNVTDPRNMVGNSTIKIIGKKKQW